jgi:hypothetical protein
VEGKHDISFLGHISKILAATESDIPDLIEAEKSGALIFVPLGGSSLDLWRNRLVNLNRPEFYLTDRDNTPPNPAKYQKQVNDWNARHNCKAWVTSKRELENYLHLSLLQNSFSTYAGQGLDFDDVPALVASASPFNSKNAKKILNNKIVSQMTPNLLSEVDTSDEVRSWLREIGVALQI